MICFYGLHYYGYFRELGGGEEGDQWLLMDDAQVRVLGASWADVIRHAIKALSKPVMMLYERLPTEESEMRARRYHYTNDTISEETFKKIRKEAQKIDAERDRLQKTGDLDAEILE